MPKRIILTCITVLMTMALLFVGCVQDKSDDQEIAGIDFSDYLEIREIDGKQEAVTLQGIYGIELLLSNSGDSDFEVPEGFKIVENRNGKAIISIAFGLKIKSDMVMFTAPLDIDITVLSIVDRLEYHKTTKNNGIPVLLGDFNHDSYINLDDFMLFRNKYRLETGNDGYTTEYDIYPALKTFTEPEWATIYSENNPDGIVDLYDFVLFTINYRKSVNREPTLEWVKPESVNVSGESTISWNAIDYDKNDLEFNIRIYKDGALVKTQSLTNSTDTTCTFVEGDEYTLELTATDVVNAEVTPKSTELIKTFRVNIRPTLTKVTEDVDYVYTDTLAFEWEAADQDGTIDHMAYRLDEDDWQNTQESSKTLENYDEGEHTFSVKAVDDQGGESQVASWTFTYLNQRLELEHKNSRLYVSGYGLENVSGLTFIVDYDQQKVDMGAASLESEGVNGELLHTSDESGLYRVEIGFVEAEPTINGTLVSIGITNAVSNSSVTIDEATLLRVENEDIVEDNVDCVGITIYGVPPDGEYVLTVISSPTEAGSVCIENGGWDTMSTMTVGAGEDIVVEATAVNAYLFKRWVKEGETVNESREFSYTMPEEDIELIAEFEAIIYDYAPPQVQLVSPEDNETDVANTVTLTWEATPGTLINSGEREHATIEAYHVYFAKTDQAYSDPIIITGKEKTIQDLEFNTTYKWKVEAIQSDGASSTSSEWTFTVREEVNLYTLTLEATPAGCGSVAARGVLEVDDQRFANWTGSFSEGDEVNIQAIPATDYLFIDWKQGTSTISEDADYIYTMPGEDIDLVAEFEAIIYDHESPQIQLISPNDNISNLATSVTLTWQATPGQLIIVNDRDAVELTEFRIFFGEDRNWSEPYATLTGYNRPLEYNLTGLKYNQEYVWTVEAIQSDSKSSSPTVQSFTTVSDQYNPPQIAIVAPSSGSTNISKDATLTWEATPGQQTNTGGRVLATIDEYHLYIVQYNQAYPEEPIVVTEKEISLPDPEFNTVYKWKVVAVQCDGATATTQEATFMTEDELVFLYQDGVFVNSHGSIYNTVADIENSEPYVIEVTGGTHLYEPEESVFSNKKVTITSTNDQPFTIDMRGINRAFSLTSYAQITLENAVVINGDSTESGGAVFVDTSTSLTTHNCTFTNNHGVTGGAISIRNGGQFYSENTSITQNSATQGGGVYLALLTSWDPSPIFSATQTIISYNTGEGGIYIYSNSSVSATQTTISHNIGGGILINGGSFKGYECDITDNSENQGAESSENKGGGGIYIRTGTATLTNSQIIDNQAWKGGGVRIGHDGNAEFFANNVLISGNSAVDGGGVYIEGSTTGISLVKYWAGHFHANEVEIKGNKASNKGGGIYRSFAFVGDDNTEPWGKIYTNGVNWYESNWCCDIAVKFSVKSNGEKSNTFSEGDPVKVHENTADNVSTHQLRWNDL